MHFKFWTLKYSHPVEDVVNCWIENCIIIAPWTLNIRFSKEELNHPWLIIYVSNNEELLYWIFVFLWPWILRCNSWLASRKKEIQIFALKNHSISFFLFSQNGLNMYRRVMRIHSISKESKIEITGTLSERSLRK